MPQGIYEEREIEENNYENPMDYQQINREKYFSNQDLNPPEKQELLTITVEIGNGEQENIIILNDDTAQKVAERFCDKYDMNEDLKILFTEQIAQNMEQAKKEMDSEIEKFEDSENGQLEYVSTAIDATPQYNAFSNPPKIPNSNVHEYLSTASDGIKINSATPQDQKHSYSTPGPILINPNLGEKRTLPKQKKRFSKQKGSKSYVSLMKEPPNKPHLNSHSVLLANKKRIPGDSVYSRLHSEAVNKQKKKKQSGKKSNVSYEASTLINGSFSGHRSTKKRGRNLFDKSSNTTRNRTPNNYGEKLYQNGLK